MKKFLLFLVVFVSVISLGLTIYFFAANNEVISIKSSYLVVDANDTIATDGLLEFKNRDKNTTISYSSSNEEVLSFVDGHYVANVGGNSQIVIKTSNKSYAKLVIDVKVCDGSEEYPYILSSAEALASIGASEKYTADGHYELSSNIDLPVNTEGNWTPIAEFSGSLNGNNFAISNMTITDDTMGDNNVNAGLFSTLTQGASISNLTLENLRINTSEAVYIGSFAGVNEGELHNCVANGVITAAKKEHALKLGGVAGYNKYNEASPIIDRCGYTGGLVLTHTEDTNELIVGGVVGYNEDGTVSESYYVTGNGNNTIVNNGAKFGGIVGANIADETATANIYDSFFYVNSIAEDTTLDQIGGVTYENVNGEAVNNQVYGNYFGAKEDVDLSALYERCAVINNTTIYPNYNGMLSAEEFVNQEKFINSRTHETARTWDFENVWTMGEAYPELNRLANAGSAYTLNIDDIVADTVVETAEDLYKAIAGQHVSTSKMYDIQGQYDAESDSYVIDFADVEWKWGDAEHPIPQYMLGIEDDTMGALLSTTNVTIKNLTFQVADGANVALAVVAGQNIVIGNIKFENVTFASADNSYVAANYVAVLANVAKGTHVENVEFDTINVNVDGFIYGTYFSLYYYAPTHAIVNGYVNKVTADEALFVRAGGVVGQNSGNIQGSADNYFIVNNVKLCANEVGGVAAFNYAGNIGYVVASAINFNQVQTQENTAAFGLYSGDAILDDNGTPVSDGNIYLGGIAGKFATLPGKGSIYHVYANVTFNTDSGVNYTIYAGGVVGAMGINTSVTYAYVYGASINVGRDYSSYVGGIAGLTYGQIANSVVAGGHFTTEITANFETGALDYTRTSFVGGIAGLDGQTTSAYSIKECVANAESLQGFYVGGIAGLEYGKVEKTSCGNALETNGGLSIKGYIAGGLAGVLQYGSMTDCYAFCSLEAARSAGVFTDEFDVLHLNVSGIAGLTTFVLQNATLKGCYAVVTFSQTGVSYGSVAGVDASHNAQVVGCVYQNAGNTQSIFGTQVSHDDLTGNTYNKFFNNIGSDDKGIWTTDLGYPTFDGIANELPSNTIPTREVANAD